MSIVLAYKAFIQNGDTCIYCLIIRIAMPMLNINRLAWLGVTYIYQGIALHMALISFATYQSPLIYIVTLLAYDSSICRTAAG